MNGAQTTLQFLKDRGVRHIFGMPGGANLPLYDALFESGLTSVLARHEQGAGFMAQGFARKTGLPGVCFATSGPGAANLLTAVADAKSDSVPIIAITGQVPRGLIGTDAFQELDVMALARPVTKASYFAQSAADLPGILESAYATAMCGRPGPVWIDIPKDVQLEKLPAVPVPGMPHNGFNQKFAPAQVPAAGPAEWQLEEFRRMLAGAQKPLVYFGGGIVHSGAESLLYDFVRSAQIPAVSSINGLGVFDAADPLYGGFVGVYGFPGANAAVHACDLLIAIGARFDDRATGKLASFCPNAAIVHVDIDARELGKIVQPELAIQSDAAAFLERSGSVRADRPLWRAQFAQWKESFECAAEASLSNPEYLMSAIETEQFAAITTDVGLHQMWAARSLCIRRSRQFLTSGGMGTMGFGLPAAIGASFAAPGAPVLCITGDGSILLNIQELSVIAEFGLPVKILLLDNGHLGMVRSQQDNQFGGRISSSRFSGAPAFCDLARAFGIPAIDNCSESKLHEALASPGPVLLRFEIDAMCDVSNQVSPAKFAPARQAVPQRTAV